MEFECDPNKSESNKEKHGMDFIEAQALWDDPDLIEIPARTEDEPRFLVIGSIGKRRWSGIITYREKKLGSYQCDHPAKRGLGGCNSLLSFSHRKGKIQPPIPLC